MTLFEVLCDFARRHGVNESMLRLILLTKKSADEKSRLAWLLEEDATIEILNDTETLVALELLPPAARVRVAWQVLLVDTVARPTPDNPLNFALRVRFATPASEA